MATTYKIDDKLGITFDINGAVVVQSAWPDGTPFASKTEAEDWAKVFIGYLEDESAPQPGNSPDNPVLSDEDLVDYAAREEFERITAEAKAEADAKAEQFAAELVEAGFIVASESETSDEDVIDAEVVEEEA